MDGKYFILDNFYEANTKTFNTYEKFRKEFDINDKELIENLKKECELVLLNNR